MTPASSAPRLYLNHDVPKSAAEALRREGYDVVATVEVGLSDSPDEEQLNHAARERRALVSFNVRDYPSLHLAFLRDARPHWGIVLSKQLGVRDTIRALKALLTSKTADALRDQLLWL